ncbi:MAG: tripartite tricarboxylate transporter substrate binding protein [Burkholderiaceae bacterium]
MKKSAAAFAAVSFAATLATAAPGYPDHPVKVVVGFSAGGPTDLVARAFAEQAAKGTAQPFVVENKPGANTVLAAEAVAAAKPDGYTLLAAATNHTMIPALYAGRVRFDAARSFRPVCTLASSATVLVVGPSLPVKTVPEFLARVRARPGAVTFASPGAGSSPHLATESFMKLTATRMVHVPYKGAAPAVTDLMGGQVDAFMATVGSVLPQIRAGKLTALAVASSRRSGLLPEVPTFAEAGTPGYVVDTWYGLLAPAGVPAPVLQALEAQAQAFGASSAVRERLAGAGLEPHASCGEAFVQQVEREIVANTRLARDLDLKPE